MSDRNKCLALFQRIRRIEESVSGYCRCVTCGEVYYYTELDGGHYISRSSKATELYSENVWPQCKICNQLKNGRPEEYRDFLIHKIGKDNVLKLESMKSQIVLKKDYKKILLHLKAKLKKVELENL